MSSGLDALKSRGRGERKKPIPPPRHSPRETPVVLPEPEPQQTPDADVTVAVADVPSRTQNERPIAEAPQAPAPAGQATTHSNVVTEELRKKTISLGQREDDFLRQVVMAGMLGKVDANQSATIRLALRRLQAEMTPEEVAEEIRRGLVKTGEGGRPRF